MTTSLDLEIVAGPTRVIPVPATVVDQLLIAGPCELIGFSLRDAAAEIPSAVEGSQTSPAANVAIVTDLTVPIGLYIAKWTVELAGTVAAADANNFTLVVSGVAVTPSVNQGAVGVYPQVDVEVNATTVNNVSIKTIGAGTVGAIYSAQLSLTPVTQPDTVVELQDGNNPLAEISLGGNVADSRWYGSGGLKVRNRINLHMVSGAAVGAIYARFDKLTG